MSRYLQDMDISGPQNNRQVPWNFKDSDLGISVFYNLPRTSLRNTRLNASSKGDKIIK